MAFVLLLISATLGVIGVAKETRDANAKLTFAGKLTIAGIALSALLAVVQQVIDNKDKQEQVSQARTLARKQLAVMNQTLLDVKRSLHAIPASFTMDIYREIPCAMLQPLTQKALCNDNNVGVLRWERSKAVRDDVARFIEPFYAMVFANGRTPSGDPEDADIAVRYSGNQRPQDILLDYNSQTKALVVRYCRAPVDSVMGTDRLRSFEELPGCVLVIDQRSLVCGGGCEVTRAAVVTPTGHSVVVKALIRDSKSETFQGTIGPW